MTKKMNSKGTSVWDSVEDIQEALLNNLAVHSPSYAHSFSDVVQMGIDGGDDKLMSLLLNIVGFGENSKSVEEFSNYMIEECRVYAEAIKVEV